MLQVDVCFFRLPPGFPADLHYSTPISVGDVAIDDDLATFPLLTYHNYEKDVLQLFLFEILHIHRC